MTIYLTKQLKEKGLILAHGLGVQSVVVGKSWRQELETAAHIVSTVRKQAGSQLTGFILFSSGPQASAGATHI